MQKLIEGDRVVGVSLHLYRVPSYDCKVCIRSLTVVVTNSFAGDGGTGAGRQSLGARSGRTDGRRPGGQQRQCGQGRDRDAENAADRVSSGRGRRGADERCGRRR